MTNLRHSLTHVWDDLPALFYATALLIGILFAVEFSTFLFFPLILIFSPAFFYTKWDNQRFILARCLLALLCAVTGYFSVNLGYQFPQQIKGGVAGTAIVSIDSLSSSKSHFGSAWVYKGKLRSFQPDDLSINEAHGKNLPVQFMISQKKRERLIAECDYCVKGILKSEAKGSYFLKIKPSARWEKIPQSFNLAEKRFIAKEKTASYISNNYESPKAATFLSALSTGELNDRLMSNELSRFGLQHIMAISGFHFSIIAGILAFALRLFFKQTITSCLLIIVFSIYFLFLGPGPSILRAWLTIVIYHCGHVFEQRSIGLNSLGVALLVCLIIDPLMVKSLGFQFSFLATAAILLFLQPCDHIFQIVIKKRPLSISSQMSFASQHGLVLVSLLRQAMAMSIAVNLVAFPLTLFYFHKFPLLGLLYNLFFPFLVSVSMLLLLLGMIGGLFFSLIGSVIHGINNAYTHFILGMTYNIPMTWDYYIWGNWFSYEELIVYITCVLFGGLVYRTNLLSRQVELRDLLI